MLIYFSNWKNAFCMWRSHFIFVKLWKSSISSALGTCGVYCLTQPYCSC